MKRINFTSKFQKFASGNVDRVNGVLKSVSIITQGPVSGHNLTADADTIRSFLSACDKVSPLKVKMDHQDSASSVIGSISSFRIQGKKLVGDLELLKSSPHYNYVLDLASKLPKSIGLSVEFSPKTVKKNGEDVVLCKEISGCALVSSPAANPGGIFDATGGLVASNVSTVVPAQVVPSGHKRKGQSVPTCATCNEHEQLLSKLADLHNMAADKLDAMVNAQDLAERDNISSKATEAEFSARLEKQRLELEASFERRVSIAAQRQLAATGVRLSKIPDADTAFATGDILSQLDRISEPSEKTRFFNLNKDKIVAAYNRIAARKVELENKLKTEGTL